MDTKGTAIGAVAVNVATHGESENAGKIRIKVKWEEFWHFIGIWMLTAFILLGALIIITIVKGSTDILKDTLKEVDTLNMAFSLVLSALLEQMWGKESNKNWLYSLTLGLEGFLTFMGAMLFMAYSMMEITAKDNKLLEYSLQLNTGYIIVSMLVVTLGFLSRSLCKER